jgi:hypothetical protein
MKPLLWELNHLLEKKIALYDAFLALLGEEWDALTRYSLKDVEDIGSRKGKLVQRIQGLEEARIALMSRFEKKLGTGERRLTLRTLIRMQDDSINRELANTRETLLAKIAAVNKKSGEIRALMDRSALNFKKSLAFLHATVEKAASPYHADGRLGETKHQGRLLSTDV